MSHSEHKWPELLLRGLSEKEKDEYKRLLVNSDLIGRIVEILKDWKKEEEVVTKTDYDSPSWSHKQADKNGAVRFANKVLTLLDHKE